MTSPRRIVDTTDAPPQAREGLRALSDEPLPAMDLAAGEAALTAAIARTSASAAGATAAIVKLALLCATAVAAVIALALWRRSPPASSTAPRARASLRIEGRTSIAQPAPRVERARVALAASTDAAVSARAAAPSPRVRPRSTSEPSQLQREVSLLASANAALSTNPSEALELCQQSEREIRRPFLAVEREALTIIALAAVGRRAESRRRARAWLVRNGESPRAAQVRAIAE